MEYIDNLQRIAMNSVENPTYEDWLRRIRRWFSKEYSTPLLQVEEFEDEYVILAYYEHIFEEMDPETRKNKILELVETPQEKKAREIKEEEIDAEIMKEMEAEFKEIQAKKQKASLGQGVKEKKPIPSPKEEKLEEPIVFEFTDPDIKG